MAFSETSLLRSRANATFISALISIALVLVVEGIFAAVALMGNEMANHARHAVPMRLFIHDGIGEAQRELLMTRLREDAAVESLSFTSKDAAATFWREKTGEDISELLDGANPLLASIEVHLRADAITDVGIAAFRKRLTAEVIIADISYPDQWLLKAEQNVRRISFWAIPLGLVVIAIGLYLIFTTIRLTIYAQRHSIRTMQLIGATDAFIRKPFLLRGIAQGATAGTLAIVLLALLFSLIRYWLIAVPIHIPFGIWLILGSSMICLGAALGGAGSWLAVNRYLHKSLAELS